MYNRPFQLSTFPATASRVCERDPSAPEGKLGIATICNGDPKQTFDFFAHCILPIIIDILELSFLVFFYTVKTFPLPDVNHVVVISESHLTSFPRTGV